MKTKRTVLLDVGGVLFPDPWETLLLAGELSAELGVDKATLQTVGEVLWSEIATHPERTASWWWEAVEDRLRRKIPRECVLRAEKLLAPVPHAKDLLEAGAAGGALGVISNSTAFWWPLQRALLEWDPPRELTFLSHERGVEKSSGLFELAARELSGEVLVVDDEASSIEQAEAVGFETLHHPPLGDLVPTIEAVQEWVGH